MKYLALTVKLQGSHITKVYPHVTEATARHAVRGRYHDL
jgi:hypothetical protein